MLKKFITFVICLAFLHTQIPTYAGSGHPDFGDGVPLGSTTSTIYTGERDIFVDEEGKSRKNPILQCGESPFEMCAATPARRVTRCIQENPESLKFSAYMTGAVYCFAVPFILIFTTMTFLAIYFDDDINKGSSK